MFSDIQERFKNFSDVSKFNKSLIFICFSPFFLTRKHLLCVRRAEKTFSTKIKKWRRTLTMIMLLAVGAYHVTFLKTHTYTQTHPNTDTPKHTHRHTQTHTQTHTHTHTHPCKHTQTHTTTHIIYKWSAYCCKCIACTVAKHTLTQTHTYTHTHTHAHKITCTQNHMHTNIRIEEKHFQTILCFVVD